jgi:NAD(P)-dependent dehydrogenase (short-subunit alcohol dehydrogenase family)
METHYFGTLDVTRAFVPVIEGNGGGAILNVLSVLSGAPARKRCLLRGQSGGLGVDRCAAPGARSGGIHVASLHVGYMDTDMVSYVPADHKIDPAMVATLAREQAGSRRTFCSCNPSGAGSADCGEYVRGDLLHGRLLRRDSSSYPLLNSMFWWHCPFS